eukprot:TRINITY_DN4436_c1_g1_i2.p1 TRINITY_DN4436_c1_g1~~TRINITY_DN4436_c1_g1_i2.p1  ORF type:complete len:182 (-),score=2.58 TRINITY_DN4436_c1_g1_i2:54-599(-)
MRNNSELSPHCGSLIIPEEFGSIIWCLLCCERLLVFRIHPWIRSMILFDQGVIRSCADKIGISAENPLSAGDFSRSHHRSRHRLQPKPIPPQPSNFKPVTANPTHLPIHRNPIVEHREPHPNPSSLDPNPSPKSRNPKPVRPSPEPNPVDLCPFDLCSVGWHPPSREREKKTHTHTHTQGD